ncbi:multiple sugar transport system permease protein [Kribbella orskensis]|uniref:Multiple sugar transport system permease protein n=1 Tax=Kribbella orskensis TaxID=2512216 RepID=A0ABY2BHC7_9ACTN|nr:MULTISPECIES: carbohydrate ABC transporter permease [Kribbella]TCN38394.1 multiple sugar transport system permease protein [Kribbella sp. VKM Ac-2500]TCO20076.1 multiple sugar transport system permease protein [Kribbella orskensis]
MSTAVLERTSPTVRSAARPPRRTRYVSTAILLLGALYCLLPVAWVVIAATKGPEDLFTTFSFWPSFNGGFGYNLSHLLEFRDGIFWKWALNSLLYAGAGSLLSVGISVTAGYALAKYRFRGRETIFRCILAGVLVPQITLAVPQYLLMSKLGLVNSYWSVLLPSIISPYCIYLSRIYASAVVSDDMLEAGRIDGAGEYRLAWSIGMPPMIPGMVTIFLLQFVAIWNNFLLPYIMISDDRHFPMTVGLFSMLNQGASQPALYSLVIMGAFLSVLPLIALFLFLQRYWRIDLVSGAVKG